MVIAIKNRKTKNNSEKEQTSQNTNQLLGKKRNSKQNKQGTNLNIPNFLNDCLQEIIQTQSIQSRDDILSLPVLEKKSNQQQQQIQQQPMNIYNQISINVITNNPICSQSQISQPTQISQNQQHQAQQSTFIPQSTSSENILKETIIENNYDLFNLDDNIHDFYNISGSRNILEFNDEILDDFLNFD